MTKPENIHAYLYLIFVGLMQMLKVKKNQISHYFPKSFKMIREQHIVTYFTFLDKCFLENYSKSRERFLLQTC